MHVKNPTTNSQAFCQWFMAHQTLILDGQSRIRLTTQQHAGDLQLPATSSLQALFQDDEKRAEVRRIIFDAFQMHFVIDPSNVGQLRIRLSRKAPPSAIEERGLHKEAIEFHSQAQLIDEASDGVKAFTGIVMELIAGDPDVVLIDEPEAFLHPALASRLGLEISKAALASDKRVFVSTHSPSFVMGCIQSGVPLNIVRLTYQATVATSRILPSSDVMRLMRHPLLRSTGVLSGLFYEFVVVTESDADRAFYQEVNERLLQFKPDCGIPNCLFINAQNKQTINTIIRPLRQLGIPAVGIVDIDVIKEGGKVWASLLESANVPDISRDSFAHSRNAINKAFEETHRNMKTEGGVKLLPTDSAAGARDLFAQLSKCGLFVVENGELESWLTKFEVSGHGPQWLVSMFEKMGDDPKSSQYAQPTEDDVWRFMSQIKKWLVNPHRNGIPL
jgi:hypothetical protein